MGWRDFISAQHASKPKFMALVEALARPFEDSIAVSRQCVPAYDLDTAVGTQLDAIGLWLGATRQLSVPVLGVHFSFDVPGLGFDEGSWEGQFAPESGVTELDDDNYRLVLKARAINNRWGGTVDEAYALSDAVFPAGFLMYLKSNGDMSIAVGINQAAASGALTKKLLESGTINFKPAGVRVSDMTYVGPQFGFGENSAALAGFDEGYFWS